MYAGHAALAVLAKGIRPRIPMALLVPVAFGPDVVAWIFDSANHPDRMISHSLVSVGLVATVIAVIYRLVSHSTADAVAVWLTYVSHWPADFITGTKPTWPGGPHVGMLVYQHAVTDVVLESLLIILCWLIYRRSLAPERRSSLLSFGVPVGLITLQVVLAIVQSPVMQAPIREAVTRLYQSLVP